jgi:NADH-quinone oxidoreductase subunit I
VEACPTDAITHGHDFEIASFNTSTLVYRKEQLLTQIAPGKTGKVVVQSEQAAPAH